MRMRVTPVRFVYVLCAHGVACMRMHVFCITFERDCINVSLKLWILAKIYLAGEIQNSLKVLQIPDVSNPENLLVPRTEL